MKKLLCLVLIILLAIPGLPAGAQARGILLPTSAGSISAVAMHGGALLFTTSEGQLYRLGRDEAEPTLLSSTLTGMDDALLAEVEQLYLLNLQTATLTSLQEEGGSLARAGVLPLDLSAINNPEALYNPGNAFVLQGTLYLVISQLFSPMQPSLLAIDISTGKATAHEVEGLIYATPYRAGQLLCTLRDPGLDEKTQLPKPSRLASYDLATRTVTDLGPLPYPFDGNAFPVGYDPQSDHIYVLGHRELFRLEEDGRAIPCAYSPFPQMSYAKAGQLPMLPEQETVILGHNSLIWLSRDPANLPTGRLQLRGQMMSDLYQNAAICAGGIAIHTQHASYEEVQRMLLSGDTDTDIFVINSQFYDPLLIMGKGYAQDLSGSQILRDFVDDCFPFIQDYVQQGGQLLMLPVGITLPCMGYEPRTFEAFGLELPTTFDALCALLDGWSPEDKPGLLPMTTDSYPNHLATLAIRLYADQVDRAGGTLSFRDPLLRQMLQTAAATDTADFPVQKTLGEVQAVLMDMSLRLLMDAQFTTAPDTLTTFDRYANGKLPLYLAPSADKAPAVPAELELMFVNPRSQRMEQAIAFVEQCAQSLPAMDRVMLQPGLDVLIESTDFGRTMQAYEGFLAEARARAAQAEGAQKRELDAEVLRQEKQLEEIARTQRYAVDKEGLARYRDIAQRAFVRRYSIQQPMQSPEIQLLIKRWLDGQISLDQCLDEAENKLHLMQMEGR